MTDLIPVDIDQDKVLQTLSINVRDPRSQGVILVCQKYGLDPFLKEVVVIQGTPYITKAGYFHIAHRSGVFDGIDILEEKETEQLCSARIAVYRKDMRRPFVASARFKKAEAKGRDPMDMALARATRRALQQAFGVADVFGNADDVHDVDLVEGGGDDAPSPSTIEVPAITAQAVVESVENDTEHVEPPEERGYKGVPGVPPFPSDDPAEPTLVQKLTHTVPGTDEETGEVADEAVRNSLLERIAYLDEEQRKGFAIEWKRAKLGSLKDGKGAPLLASDVGRAQDLLYEAHEQQRAVYERRRKHVNSMLKDIGVTSDEARHELIREATHGETESTKALLGRHVKAIKEAVDTYTEADADEPVEMFQ